MNSILAFLIVAHLIGDFLLQNNWMQAKSKNSWVCSAHVLVYSIPFSLIYIVFQPLPWWAFILIFAEHLLQDRFALHLKWMAFYKQTPPDKWPVGPLCVDQSFHIAFIAFVVFIST